MSRSAIATTRKKQPLTPAERLHALDPDLAALFDTWEAQLNQDYDLAMNDQPAPPILDAEEALAFELGRFHLAADPLLEVADKISEARDAAYMTLGRVEQEIARRYVDALRVTRQPALPPPDRHIDDEDQTLRIIHQAAVEVLEDPDPEPGELPEGTPPWDDPEGATLAAKPRRSKWSSAGYARRWIAGAAAICALPLVAAVAIVARWGW